jgi:hypothetical protein
MLSSLSDEITRYRILESPTAFFLKDLKRILFNCVLLLLLEDLRCYYHKLLESILYGVTAGGHHAS